MVSKSGIQQIGSLGGFFVLGCVANFWVGKDGEFFLCAEQKLWGLKLARTTKGC
jgi:gluconolactonase